MPRRRMYAAGTRSGSGPQARSIPTSTKPEQEDTKVMLPRDDPKPEGDWPTPDAEPGDPVPKPDVQPPGDMPTPDEQPPADMPKVREPDDPGGRM